MVVGKSHTKWKLSLIERLQEGNNSLTVGISVIECHVYTTPGHLVTIWDTFHWCGQNLLC